jgi:hypothetical protein
MQRFALPVTETIKKQFPGATKDQFIIAEFGEFVELAKRTKPNREALERNPWSGSLTWAETLQKLEHGDMRDVGKSDALLDKLDVIPAPTARHEWIDDVTGGWANVPAFLAGQPLNMRRRVKRENEFQPLAVVVNLLASASTSFEQAHQRGIAILAVVRAIATRRPVELYVGVTASNNHSGSGTTDNVYFRIDTSPMDLAHAAFCLANPAVYRQIAFQILREQFNTAPSIPLPYTASLMDKAEGQFYQIVGHAFPHVNDVLAIPHLFGKHPSLNDPVAWVQQMVHHYGEHGDQQELTEAA